MSVISVFEFCCALSAKISVVFAKRFVLFASGSAVFQNYKGVQTNGHAINATYISASTFSFWVERFVYSSYDSSLYLMNKSDG